MGTSFVVGSMPRRYPPRRRRAPWRAARTGPAARRAAARSARPPEAPGVRNSPCAVDAAAGSGKIPRMARSIWTGAISFGLVTVPVKLYSAVIAQDASASTSSTRRPACASPRSASTPRPARRCPTSDIVKGYEIAPGPLRRHRARTSSRRSTRRRRDDRDRGLRRARRDRPDLLRPPVLPRARRRAAPSPTGCCSRRCARRGKVAIAKVVIRQKENLVAHPPDGGRRPRHGDDDLRRRGRRPRRASTSSRPSREIEVNDRELAIAKQLVESLAGRLRAREVPRHVPRGGPVAHRAQGRRRGDRHPARVPRRHGPGARPHERAEGQPRRGPQARQRRGQAEAPRAAKGKGDGRRPSAKAPAKRSTRAKAGTKK